MDGHVGGWRKGDPFSHDLVSVGPASNPHALFLFPRRAVSVTGLAVLASLGHSGIPSHHAAPPIPLPAAVSCSLSVSIFAGAHSLARALSFAHLPTLAWHVNTSPSLMPSRFLWPFLKWLPSLQGEQRYAVRTKLKRTKTDICHAAIRWNIRNTWKRVKLFKHQRDSFKSTLFSHTFNLFSLLSDTWKYFWQAGPHGSQPPWASMSPWQHQRGRHVIIANPWPASPLHSLYLP